MRERERERERERKREREKKNSLHSPLFPIMGYGVIKIYIYKLNALKI